MKKLLFAAVDMNVGGIETALVTLVNTLADRNYNITLVLEKKQGIFLQDLRKNIKVVEYCPSTCTNVLIRKGINFAKRIGFWLQYRKKFDFSASFATYSNMASYVARTASKNNALWGHADYLELFQDESKMKKFFENLHHEKFRRIVFVSNKACETYLQVYPNMQERVVFCNNLIDAKKIENFAKEPILQKREGYTFLNVGRHDEKQKKLTRILEAAKNLKKEEDCFQIWFIGKGNDTKMYEELVEQYGLEQHIQFLGEQKNPYPYMKLADAILLSSDYEGYPVVFMEAFVLNKPLITTNVSDALADVENRFGKVTSKNTEEIYQAMKEFLQHGFTIKEPFSAEEYNKKIMETIENMINS